MKRITQITLCNYRAFFNEKDDENKYQINLPNGENLLIYGENGSGKSSLFQSLKDLFLSANDNTIEPQVNIYTTGRPDLPQTQVKIKVSELNNHELEFTEIEDIYFDNNAPTTSRNVLLNDSTKAFLTYKDLSKTYNIDLNIKSNNPNLFEFFMENLLSQITDSSTNRIFHDSLKDLIERVETIDETVDQTLEAHDENEPGKTLKQTKGIKQVREDIQGKIDDDIMNFNIGINEELLTAIKKVNDYLEHYFKSNIEVYIKNENNYLILNEDNKVIKELFLGLKFFNTEIENHPYPLFLNEARLTSIAICMYLAALKNDNIIKEGSNLIFLDDIFIGLDSSNRIPLLEILENDFNDFQILITTYDRYWFELAKNWFERKSKNSWSFFELYADDYTHSDREIPKLIPYISALSKALFYYKQNDYSASGNYLRKACEEILEKILPPICLKNTEGLFERNLSKMLDRAIIFFNVLEIPIDDLSSLAVYLQSLMNPLSHYDINISVYRKEIKDVEKAINNLQSHDFSKTKFKKILDKNSMLKLTYRVNADTENVYEIEIKDDLWIYQHEFKTNISLGAVVCKNINLYEIKDGSGNEFFHNKIESHSLKEFSLVGIKNI